MSQTEGCSCVGSNHSRKLRGWASWIFPSALLMILPKCPLCVIGYVSLATGVTMSVTFARSIQIMTIFICVVLLAHSAFRYSRLVIRSQRS